MPSTFTSSTGIEKIADGEQTGLWGQTTNRNFDIVDRVLSQVGSIALTGSTYTLTTSTSGVLSDGHYSVIRFTGTPGATCTVTASPNTLQRIYTVYNATNQSVVISQGSGSTVTIPAGEVAQVYSDGAGATAAVTQLTDKLKDVLYSGDIGTTLQAYDVDLGAIAALSPTDGNFIVGNGSTWVAESGNTALTSLGVTATASELNIMDGVTATTAELNYVDGVTSNIQTQLDGKQPIDTDLTAIAAISSNGLIARTGSGTAEARTLTGTSDQITVTDGDGVSGNPTISLSFAAQATVEAGTDTVSPVNSLRVAQAIAANRPSVAGTTKTDTFSTTSSSYTAITGLTAAITPKTTASRVKVTVSISVGTSSNQPAYIQLTRNGTAIALGDSAGSREQVTLEAFIDSTASAAILRTFSFSFLDTPASASLLTYGLQVRNQFRTATPGTFYVNRSHNDTDNIGYARGISTIIVEEIL